jgi:nucleoside-diphosphate-sugar epimerase
MTDIAGKTVLVTGATGFLGGQMARRLAEQGANVRALARKIERAGYIKDTPGIEIVLGDVTEPRTLEAAATGCDLVLHVAALIQGGWSDQDRVNVQGTRHVMQAAAQAGASRVVYISSVAVYGYRYPHDVTEDHPPQPAHEVYARTKLGGEWAARELSGKLGVEYSIVRPAYIYGPRSGAWTGQIFGLAKRDPVLFVGAGGGAAHSVHVDDVVGLALTTAVHPAAAGAIFNAAPDPAPTWREWLEAYRALTGKPMRWIGVPPGFLKPAAHIAARLIPGGGLASSLPDLLDYSQRYFSYRMTKARDLLGWENRVTLADGVAGTAGWLRERGLLG